MLLYRCFAWDQSVPARADGGALFIARAWQGDGRHDNPDHYGCLYLSAQPVSCVVEQLASFRGRRFNPRMLIRRQLPLALATLRLYEQVELIDLDQPTTLLRENLHPSHVATRHRHITQPQALRLWGGHPEAAGFAWWSTHEASWTNITVFDRAQRLLHIERVDELPAGHAVVYRGST